MFTSNGPRSDVNIQNKRNWQKIYNCYKHAMHRDISVQAEVRNEKLLIDKTRPTAIGYLSE